MEREFHLKSLLKGLVYVHLVNFSMRKVGLAGIADAGWTRRPRCPQKNVQRVCGDG